jgi:hypothetical protein
MMCYEPSEQHPLAVGCPPQPHCYRSDRPEHSYIRKSYPFTSATGWKGEGETRKILGTRPNRGLCPRASIILGEDAKRPNTEKDTGSHQQNSGDLGWTKLDGSLLQNPGPTPAITSPAGDQQLHSRPLYPPPATNSQEDDQAGSPAKPIGMRPVAVHTGTATSPVTTTKSGRASRLPKHLTNDYIL